MASKYRLCVQLDASTLGAGAYSIKVEQRGEHGLFRVTYGGEVHEGLTYARALHEFGASVFHALACTGMLGNEGE